MTDSGQYQLRCELRSHTDDVRCLCVTDAGLVTGSRDKTIKLWVEDGPSSFTNAATLVGHTSYVSALGYVSAGSASPLPGGTLLSGSMDKTIGLWDLSSASMVHQLQGHEQQISCVGATASAIVSASQDKTLKIWRGEICTATLQGHESAVQTLVVLPDSGEDELVASGSSDRTIRLWSVSKGQCTGVVQAHDDSVRSLALVPGVGIVSGSHDTTLKVWTLTGDCITQMVGHTSLVYSVAVTSDGSLVASGSEDNTARVWQLDGTCLQAIEHPGCVWAVTFLPNGDLVTACSDGVARVWTQEESRKASAEQLEVFSATLNAYKEEKKRKENEQGEGGLPAGLKLEDPSVLQAPGGRDGQTIVVKEGSAGVAYSWDAAKGEWERIGEVVSGPEMAASSGKKWHNGQEWDYVIDVDTGNEGAILKLCMNNGENPYMVADRFLEENDMPVAFKEQIVQFILQNTGAGGGAGSGGGGQYVDPYTGASAYVPPPPGGSVAAPVVTGDGAVTGGGFDPFTGSSRPVAAVKHLPAKGFLLFDAPPPAEGLRKKMGEFNALLAADPSTASLAVSEADMGEGGALSALLSAAGASAGQPRSFDAAAVSALLPQLLSWPPEQLFPCLDLARIVMLDTNAAGIVAESAQTVSADAAAGSLGRAIYAAFTADPAVPASQQVALRCMCNALAQPALQIWARTHLHTFLALAAPSTASAAKGVRLGLATLLINTALTLIKLPGDELEDKAQVVALAGALLGNCPAEDEEPRYRALVAVGTLLPEHSQVRSTAKQLGFLSLASDMQSAGGKVGEVAQEVAALLRL